MPRRRLSQLIIPFLLFTLPIVQLTNAYPIHGQPLPHDALAVRTLISPDPLSLTEPSDPDLSVQWKLLPRIEAPTYDEALYVNNKGWSKHDLQEQGFAPADGFQPVKVRPKWLAFEIPNLPEPKPSSDRQHRDSDLESRKQIVKNLEDERERLDGWLNDSNKWLQEGVLFECERQILLQLHGLTVLDLERAKASNTLDGYGTVILKNMRVALQMHETPLPLPVEYFKEELEREITTVLKYYEGVIRAKYTRFDGTWINPNYKDYKKLAERVELDLEKGVKVKPKDEVHTLHG